MQFGGPLKGERLPYSSRDRPIESSETYSSSAQGSTVRPVCVSGHVFTSSFSNLDYACTISTNYSLRITTCACLLHITYFGVAGVVSGGLIVSTSITVIKSDICSAFLMISMRTTNNNNMNAIVVSRNARHSAVSAREWQVRAVSMVSILEDPRLSSRFKVTPRTV